MIMKRFFLILAMISMLPLGASAQWYLFPGSKKKQAKEQPVKDTVVVVSQDSSAVSELLEAKSGHKNDFIYDKPEVMTITMVLPLQASSTNPSSSFLEMYSGAMLAVKDLSEYGVKASLRVVDSAGEAFSTSTDWHGSSDLIIGPVSYKDILSTLPVCEAHQMIVSPLDQKAAMLVDSCSVVQAPSPWTRQTDELIDWMSSELEFGDEVIVLKDKAAQSLGEQGTHMLFKLGEKNIRYRTIGSLEELALEDNIRYRILIASDNDAYITRSIKSIGIASELKKQITLYTTSRVRNCVDGNSFDLYNANARMTAAYHIDYNDEAVKAFVLKYRALFKNEPGSFAFQGYDLMHYFLGMYADYGRNWHKKLPEKSERGMQSDFQFDKDVRNGKENIAIRKVIYNQDLTTTLL